MRGTRKKRRWKPLRILGPLNPQPPIQIRLLRVETDYFCAGAVWRKIFNVWSCYKVAPILHWMKRMNPDQAKIALLKMGAKFEWLTPVATATPNSRMKN